MNDSINSSNTTYPVIDYPQFYFSATVEIFLPILHLYLLVSYIYFVKNKSKKDEKRNNHYSNPTKKRIMFGLYIIAIVTAFGKSCLWQRFIYTGRPVSALDCAVSLSTYYALSSIGFLSLYCLLWLRQHTLYSLPILRELLPIHVLRFSNTLLPFMLISGISLLVGLVLSNPSSRIVYVEETQTCVFPSTNQTALNLVTSGSYGLLLLSQGSLLFCFLYALQLHQHHQRYHRSMCRIPSACNGFASSTKSLNRLMQNCSIAAAIAMITDISAIVALFLLDSTSSQLYVLMVFEIDHSINLGCVVFCFATWRRMLNPWQWNSLKKCYCKTFNPTPNNKMVVDIIH